METMQALRKMRPGVGNVELVEVPVPEIGPDEVLMKVYAAGHLRQRSAHPGGSPLLPRARDAGPRVLRHRLSGWART